MFSFHLFLYLFIFFSYIFCDTIIYTADSTYNLPSNCSSLDSCGSFICPCIGLNNSINQINNLNNISNITIYLFSGEYYGENNTNIHINTSISIIGLYGSSNTIISYNNQSLLFDISRNCYVNIEGITFSHLSSYDSITPNLINMLFNSSIIINNCIINNSIGKIFHIGYNCEFSLTNSLISQNQANTLFIDIASSSKINYCYVTNNTSPILLSGIELISINISNSYISHNNYSTGFEWSKQIDNPTNTILENNTFISNTVTDQTLYIRNATIFIKDCFFEDSIYTNNAAIVTEDSSIFGDTLTFSRNYGIGTTDMSIICSSNIDIFLNNIHISSTNSATFESTSSILLTGCNYYITDMYFLECFNQPGSSGNLIMLDTLPSSTIIFDNIDAELCGLGKGISTNLFSFNINDESNVTILNSFFKKLAVNDNRYSLDIYINPTGIFNLQNSIFISVTDAIKISGPGNIINSSFNGGLRNTQSALTLQNGIQVIENTNFTNHDTTSVYIENSDCTFINCIFSDNKSENNKNDESGGSVYISLSYTEFSNCSWSNNRAIANGGAIYVYESELDIINCNFNNNTSLYQNGGAISINAKSDVSIDDCIFKNNFAGYGGAIEIGDTSKLKLRNSIISNNTAFQGGGGVHLQNRIPFSSILTNNKILYNICTYGYGGGISTHFFASPVIANCSISYNTAISGGGLSITDGSNAMILNTTIQSNIASSSGGGLNIQGYSKPIIEDSIIIDNIVNSTAGGILVKDISAPFIRNSIISNNYSPNRGGGAVLTDKSNSTFINCTINNNNSGGSGGAISFSITAYGEFSNCIINNNTGLSSGGGIAFHNDCYPSFYFVTISSNTASEGGAISLEDSSAPIFESCIFDNNTALSNGGGIVASDFSSILINYSNFNNNTASAGHGGCVKISDFSFINISNSNFDNNKAGSGGAIYMSSLNCIYTYNCNFTNNFARFDGGGIIFEGNSYGFLSYSYFINNTATDTGGAIKVQDTSYPSLDHIIFYNNKVLGSIDNLGQGGALGIWDTSHPSISNSIIYNNKAIFGGGCFIHVFASPILEHIQVYNNNALNGGGFHIQSFLTSMKNISIISNNAEFGAGLYLDSSFTQPNVSICLNCTFEKNNATNSGGGIYFRTLFDFSGLTKDNNDNNLNPIILNNNSLIRERLSFAFTNPIFNNNYALRGGGLFYSGGVSFINFGPTCIFSNNSALEFGGGLYINQLNKDTDELIWMNNATFSNNYAHYAGTNIGWNIITNDDPGTFCENCIYGNANSTFNGYQTDKGWATAPSKLTFGEFQCPSSLYVTSNPFKVSTILYDYFSTNVTGNIDIDNNITITVDHYGDCNLLTNSFTSKVNSSTAISLFNNLTIQGKDKHSCQLVFSAPFMRNVFIQPIACNISLYGCPPGQIVESSNNYDYCVVGTSDSFFLSGKITIILACIVIFLLLLILCVFSFAIFKFGKRRYKKYKRIRTLIPDLERKPTVSLESILNDPNIPHIPWEEIHIQDRIGIGANGIVSRGIWKLKGKNIKKYKNTKIDIAVKELLMEQIELLNPITLEEFLIEIKFLSKLNNKNVVKFLGISTPSTITKLYLVTELMHFGSLRDVLDRDNTLPWTQRVKLAKDAAKGMAYLHKRNIIHRDLKSQNLLVDKTWTCKIADFGISTVKEAHTRTMTCIGTPMYMAPEVLGKAKYSEKADVFSFGILLVEIYTGKIPYSSKEYADLNQAQLMFKICNENARPITESFPEQLRELINDCWNMDPKLRPSFSEIVVRLRRLKYIQDYNNIDNNNNIFWDHVKEESKASAFLSVDSILTSERIISNKKRKHLSDNKLHNSVGEKLDTIEEELSDMSEDQISVKSIFSIQ